MENVKKELPEDYIPKKDVQQEEFVQKYLSFDGRGIKIAIIDSGVDVSLDGLQKTSTGLPKIIDCFDFTGIGDVDTTITKKIGQNRLITLLSGRKVKIPKIWKNPSDLWHLGMKACHDLYSEILDYRKSKNADKKLVNLYSAEMKKPQENAWKVKENNITYPEMISKDFNVDCIVWHNGEIWQASLITESCKNLKDAKVLTNFRDGHDYCILFENLACCITIYNNGNLLELFFPHHHHGSLVGQTAAAHFPGQPDKDGIAPGAQIISINIIHKNAKIDALQKALIKCIELGVDIINFSICFSQFNEIGINEILKNVVDEHGIMIIKSAGNEGPFLSSMKNSKINDCLDKLFIIGQVFTTDVKKLVGKETIEHSPYIWYNSSKGPLSNGIRGVSFVAPGDAIVECTKWYYKKKLSINGTSVSTPIVAGAIACLLSGLKANSIPYSPATIKMALSNKAFLPDSEDRLGFGNGIIQILSAFEYFKNFKEIIPKIQFPQICINETNLKGIFIIYKNDTDENVFDYCINPKNLNIEKEISWILKLSPENHEHVKHSKIVENNLFNVKIHTINLSPGNVYYSEIHGFHPSNFSLGSIFHLPITVIIPENVVNYSIQKEIFIQPPSMFHHFYNPPKNSRKSTVKLIDPENNNNLIIFEKIIQKSKYMNEIRNYFIPKPKITPWCVHVKWETASFEIFIYQYVFVEKKFELKCNIEICFD